MPRIHVCSLARLHDTVAETGARRVLTIINVNTPVTRPASIAPDDHLYLGVSDIVTPLDGHILPGEPHVRAILDFAQGWDRAAPLVVHCFAGVSRSTASAFIAACALRPDIAEDDFAGQIRARSPTATPNARLVAVADAAMARGGRMIAAIERIGRGVDCYEGEPFSLDIGRK
ncbi:MAG: tyrosine phosphatase family protein [Methylobacteriaceae bacterium]|nr:tyrosine phosphatase family protein [Methylobacteriaceae bacterium]